MTRGSLPNQDVKLLHWAQEFSRQLSESPEAFGVSPEAAAELAVAVEEYAIVFADAANLAIRSRSIVLAKNEKRTILQSIARGLVKMIDARPQTTDQQRNSLGINIRKSRTRIAAPEGRPSMQVKSVEGRRVIVQTYDVSSESFHRKAIDAASVAVYSFVGERPPEETTAYQFHGIHSKSKVTLDFPHTVPSGATVWLCARWLNAKGQSGPSSDPRMFTLQGGPAAMVPVGIRQAA